MAIDRALLETSPVPVLRAYTWARACVTIGYFGPEEEAALTHPGLPIIRRWTGGGTVLHGEDAPYSLIVPRAESFSRVRPAESYCAIHGALATALRASVPDVHQATSRAPKRSDACFENPVADDLLVKGIKVAGAGQRRTRHGLLHQGSVQLGNSAFKDVQKFADILARKTTPFEDASGVLKQALLLVFPKPEFHNSNSLPATKT
jgi:lipoate-protein ligase A